MFTRIARFRTALLAAALALPLAGCESPSGPSQRDRLALAQAKAAWAALGIDDYTMVVGTYCFCGVQEIRFTVVDGVVTERVVLDDGTPLPPNSFSNVETIDAMLEHIEQAIDEGVASLLAEYDERGVPTNVAIDYVENAVDEEFGWGVKSLLIPES
jgi:hypothetical protein